MILDSQLLDALIVIGIVMGQAYLWCWFDNRRVEFRKSILDEQRKKDSKHG